MGSGTYKNLNFYELPVKKNRMVKLVIFLNVVSCRGVPLPEKPRVPWGGCRLWDQQSWLSNPQRGGKLLIFCVISFNYSNNASFF